MHVFVRQILAKVNVASGRVVNTLRAETVKAAKRITGSPADSRDNRIQELCL